MDAETQEAMRDASHYNANNLSKGRQKWFAFLKIYTTEMDTKLVFDCMFALSISIQRISEA